MAQAGGQDRGGRALGSGQEAPTEGSALTPEELFQVYRQRLVQRRLGHGNTHEEALAWSTGSDEVNAQVIGKTRPFADVVVTLGELAPESR